jgi:hypothetical protein
MDELYRFTIREVGDSFKFELYVNGDLKDERLWGNEWEALHWIANTLRTSEPFISVEERTFRKAAKAAKEKR